MCLIGFFRLLFENTHVSKDTSTWSRQSSLREPWLTRPPRWCPNGHRTPGPCRLSETSASHTPVPAPTTAEKGQHPPLVHRLSDHPSTGSGCWQRRVRLRNRRTCSVFFVLPQRES